ncbi:hypothetical protein CEXT_208471 [Caerostris extrusa]|uniref:Uncharacterized protein n=1 Tax=Caerostris extrusa TaxID=172846 RepID=A0AAV4XMM5_CAEEX|nr:hypothetical protein CEXT_208471 [Caerostris extrusa]
MAVLAELYFSDSKWTSSRIEILKKTTKYIRTLKRKQEARREFMQLLHKRIAESKAFNAECKKIMAENDPATAAVLLQQLPKVELPSIPSIIKSDVTFRFDDIDCNSDDAHSTQQEQELDSNSEDTNSTQDMDSNSEDASSAHDTDLNSEDACSSQE